MQKQLTFHDKTIDINLSNNAVLQSQQLYSVLLIEIQIYFSCLLGKRLAFYTAEKLDGTWQLKPDALSDMLKESQHLTGNIYVRFNTVMTRSCPVSDYVGPPPVTDFTIANQKPYVPGWLNIDFNEALWCGEYGWNASESGYSNTKQIRGNAISSTATG